MHLTNNCHELPVWFKSPLDQFNIRNFSSSNTPLLTKGDRPKQLTDKQKAGRLGIKDFNMSEKFNVLIAKAGYPKGPEGAAKVDEIQKSVQTETNDIYFKLMDTLILEHPEATIWDLKLENLWLTVYNREYVKLMRVLTKYKKDNNIPF